MFWPMAAEARAIQLLTQNLSPAQREQYGTRRYFEVIGGDTGKRSAFSDRNRSYGFMKRSHTSNMEGHRS